jgi:hypothetical protein
MIATPEDCVDYVNAQGLCAWSVGLPLPSIEEQTPWGDQTMLHTWFWKDDLHLEKRLYYGQLWGTGTPIFVSLKCLPFLIAAQGDCDPRDLFEKNRLSHVALTLYEHLERHGATAKKNLPYPSHTSQTPPLVKLQQHFLITKTGLTGRTRGTYGYLWGLCQEFFPDAFVQASQLPVADARAALVAQTGLSEAQLTKAFRWQELGNT